MSTKQNQEILRRVIEAGINKGNYDALDPLFEPDYQEHEYGSKPGLQGVKEDIRFLRTAFPDFHLTFEDMVADGDNVWVHTTGRGTHLGLFMGPPTNKPVAITVLEVCRFENGKIVEHWGVADKFAIMTQLGLLPRP